MLKIIVLLHVLQNPPTKQFRKIIKRTLVTSLTVIKTFRTQKILKIIIIIIKNGKIKISIIKIKTNKAKLKGLRIMKLIMFILGIFKPNPIFKQANQV